MTELPIESEQEIEIDPVCGMIVDLDQAREHALALDYEGRSYVFCGIGCRQRFEHEPTRFAIGGRAQP